MLRGKYVKKKNAAGGTYYPTAEEAKKWAALEAQADRDIATLKLNKKQVSKAIKEDLAKLELLREGLKQQNRDIQMLTERLAIALVDDLELTMREAADLLGLSHQRVHQVLTAPSGASRTRRSKKAR